MTMLSATGEVVRCRVTNVVDFVCYVCFVGRWVAGGLYMDVAAAV